MSEDNNDSQNKTWGNDERKFLHDVANPLAIAVGMIDAVMDDMEMGGDPLTEGQKRRLQKAQNAMERIRNLLKSRRTEVIAMHEAATHARAEKKD